MNEQLASCIRRIGEDLIALSDAILLPPFTSDGVADTPANPEPPKEVEKPKTTKRARTKKSDEKQESTNVEQQEPITHEQLRELLGSIAAGGHSAEVASLLKEYGEGKLSTVPEENYPALYAAAKEITQETEDQDTKGIGDDNA